MICILFICVNVAKNRFSLSSKFWDRKIDLLFSLKLNMLLWTKNRIDKNGQKLKKWTKIDKNCYENNILLLLFYIDNSCLSVISNCNIQSIRFFTPIARHEMEACSVSIANYS